MLRDKGFCPNYIEIGVGISFINTFHLIMAVLTSHVYVVEESQAPNKEVKGRNGFLHRFQQLRSYHNEIEILNCEEIPSSSLIKGVF